MSYEGRIALIQNPVSGLVFDGKEEKVRLQHFTGEKSQQWAISKISEDALKIINKGNGLALDSCHGAKHEHQIITYKFHGNGNQQWSIHGDQISTAADRNLVLDVADSHHTHGSHIILYKNHSGDNQKFRVILLA